MNRIASRSLAVFGILLLLTLFWLSAWRGMDRSALSRVPILDEAHYLQRATEIREQGWLPTEPFVMSPLYSYLVAVTGSDRLLDEHRVRIGGPPQGIRVLQALFWLGTALVLWRVGSRLFGPRWAWGPPLLWLGYAPAAILTGQVLMEIPLTFAATLALALATGHVGSQYSVGRAFLAGLLVGAAFLLRGTAIVLVLPVVLALGHGAGWRTGSFWSRVVLPTFTGLFLLVLPFTVLNSVRAQRPAPPALNAGVNLYLGNGPGAHGFFHGIPEMDVEADPSGAAYLSSRLGRVVPDAVSADRVWAALARTAITENPVRALGLWGRKVWLHLVGVEIPQVSAFSAWGRHAAVLRLLIVPWAFLAAAGLAGAVLGWRRVPALRPWLLAAALLVGLQSLFFVVTRYRIILVPALALASIVLLREALRCRGRELALVLGCLLVAALAVVPWGLAGTLREFKAGGLDNEAVRWEHLAAAVAASDSVTASRALTEASALWSRSVAVMDNRPDAWRGVARVRWAQGDPRAATEALVRGLGVVENKRDLRRDLIGMLMRQRRLGEALPQLELALQSEPSDAELLHNMVLVQAGLEQLPDAAVTARRLVEQHPTDVRGYLDLGAVLGRAGRLADAAAVYEAGLRRLPGEQELQRHRNQLDELMSEQDR